MSYGGIRFEMPALPGRELPVSIEVNLLAFGLSVKAEPVWTNRRDTSGSWSCGAVLAESTWRAARTWRTLVDALPHADLSVPHRAAESGKGGPVATS